MTVTHNMSKLCPIWSQSWDLADVILGLVSGVKKIYIYILFKNGAPCQEAVS